MTIKEILAEITLRKPSLSPEQARAAYPKYQDLFLNHTVGEAGMNSHFTLYPDRSRSIDDIISIIGLITSEGSPLLSILAGFLLHRQADTRLYYFDDGLRSPPHTHNYAELGYVAEGQYHAQIEGRDYLFNRGDVFLINKDTLRTEYFYRKNQAVFFLDITNTFFDKSMQHDTFDHKTEDFLQRFIIGGKEKYHCIRFVPKAEKFKTQELFENILSELMSPHPGTTHLILGYVEWMLSMLTAECDIEIHRNDQNAAGNALFEEIRRYLEEQYQDTTLDDLIEKFGHNMNYFNRLIKNHTGMTLSLIHI